VNTDQLRVFVVVADEMSVSGAADRLGTSQPVLSRTIKRLETDLNVTLFDRLPRGVALSPFGRVLYRQARAMLELHSRTLEEFRALKGQGRGLVRIGAGATWLEERLPRTIASFVKSRPDMHVEARFIPRYEIVEALLSGKIDLGLTQFGSEHLPADDVSYEELFKDRLTVIARKSHPLRGCLEAAPERLGELSWATTSSAMAKERIDGLLRRYELGPPDIQVTSHSIINVLEIVRNTDLVTLAPEFLVTQSDRSELVLLAPQIWTTLSKGILVPANATMSSSARQFRDHLKSVFLD
jgi:DNA-binding transcriptional LysR family regulator